MAVSVSAVADVSYLAEVAPESLRGGMVSCNELAISFGILVSFLAGRTLRGVTGKRHKYSSPEDTLLWICSGTRSPRRSDGTIETS